ncbi:MAG: M15 family metallopeptidase [Deltaproteobacteria bacterium]|nr:M15 family metallopeptidase [Deltaproteobacteria bacterium]
MVAYPDAGLSVTHGDDGVYISFGQKGRFLYSPWEGCPGVSPADTGDAPLCAVLRQPYPAGAGGRRPDPGFDPGRVRSEAFLKALYGETAADVAKDLAPVRLLGETWKFSARHGAADALRRVAAKLEKAVAADPKLKAYVLPGGGTYAWRTIQGSPHLSAHSFGICIDLNVEKGVYWLWHPDPATVEKIRVGYPQEIVDAFESEGFIWGGKCHSFDFMHFEYRPELVGPARRETRR